MGESANKSSGSKQLFKQSFNSRYIDRSSLETLLKSYFGDDYVLGRVLDDWVVVTPKQLTVVCLKI